MANVGYPYVTNGSAALKHSKNGHLKMDITQTQNEANALLTELMSTGTMNHQIAGG